MNYSQFKQYLFSNLWWGENRRPSRKAGKQVLTLVSPPLSGVWGIDISHWNRPPVALHLMKELYGLQFVIIKGCDGSLNSRYYIEHKQAAKDAGLPWGVYNWLYPNNRVSIAAQVAAWYARYAEDIPPMGIFIDAEWTTYGGQSANPSATDLRSAHDKWRVASREKATTYTAMGYSDQYLRGFDFSLEELWVASYGGAHPSMPAGATDHTFWQYTSTLDGHALDPAGNAELDGNLYNGSQDSFNQRYGGTTEPPIGGSMWYRINTTALNIRKGPGASYQDLGDLVLGDKIEVTAAAMGGWLPIARIWRAGNGAIETIPSAWCSAAYCVATDSPIVEPPPPPPPTGPAVHIDIQLAAGSTLTVTDANGDVLWSVTA